MSSSPLSRRSFLGTSLKLGAGAAALGVAGTGARAWASADAPGGRSALDAVTPAGRAPEVMQHFRSRPDLRPPGVTITKSPTLSTTGLPPYIFLAPRASAAGQPVETTGLMILDLSGHLVWWQQMDSPDALPFNFRVQIYRGEPTLTWYEGEVGEAHYGVKGTGVLADSSYSQIGSVRTHNYGTDLHEFLVTPYDTALLTAYQPRGKILIGHAQEVSIASNHLDWAWSSYPDVLPSESFTGPTGDYFHINSIDLWPGRERNVLISGRDTSAVYLVSRETKKILWRLGGKRSSFAMGTGTRFEFQHDARPHHDGSGLSLFDDASEGLVEKQSWGKVFNLDQKRKTATLRHEYSHTTVPLDVPSQGNNQLLANGDHFVGWGANPYFSLFSGSNTTVELPLVLDGRLPAGIENYRAFMAFWEGHPPEDHLVLSVYHGHRNGLFEAYTCWNGATEVAYYWISAGTSSRLKVVATSERHGFETNIPFDAGNATDFQVTAFNAKRKLLGRSKIVGVTK